MKKYDRVLWDWNGTLLDDLDMNYEVMKAMLLKTGKTEFPSKEFYLEQGTTPKSQLLVDVYPQYAKVKYKFHRVHHEVDYSGFTQPLHFKEDYSNEDKPIVNNLGIKIIEIPREWYNTEKDTEEYLSQHWREFKQYDMNTLFMPGGEMIRG